MARGSDEAEADPARPLGPESAARLLAFARATVLATVRREGLPPLPDDAELSGRAGAFVTLHRGGALRGCIGHVEPDLSVAEATRRMAVSASRDDPRFPPVAPEELEGLEVEVSVLTPPRPAGPDDVVPGRDGLIVRRGGCLGVLLPQVAPEMGWGRLELLNGVCRKAGLPATAWRDAETELLAFRAQVIRGSDAE